MIVTSRHDSQQLRATALCLIAVDLGWIIAMLGEPAVPGTPDDFYWYCFWSSEMKSMRLSRTVTLGLAMAALHVCCAGAAEFVVEDPACKNVKAAELEALQKKLRDAGAIRATDTIVCKIGSSPTVAEKNWGVSDIFKRLGGGACQERNQINREECADKVDATERDTCQDAEKARFEASKSACQ